jgi:hypothetical protein
MILTDHVDVTASGGLLDHLEGSQPRAKLLITGIASHLNHVADTTCHIGDALEAAGMSVAYITTRRAATRAPIGKEASRRIRK